MSQYAFFLKQKEIASSTKYIFSEKSQKIHNGYELDKVFGIKYSNTFINRSLFLLFKILNYKKKSKLIKLIQESLKKLNIKTLNEGDNYEFDPNNILPSKGITFYEGGWHSVKYIKDIEKEIANAYIFKIDKISNENSQVLKIIKKCNSVSIHIRRGDFLNEENYEKFGKVCTLNYFKKAIEKTSALIKNPHFFIFSNDINWAKNNFHGEQFSFVDININENSWIDMFLISNCKHNICSNGSFSWWAAWLNKNPAKIVIVPKYFISNRYVKDIYPENWIKLSDY
jgi:hypothetical protein